MTPELRPDSPVKSQYSVPPPLFPQLTPPSTWPCPARGEAPPRSRLTSVAPSASTGLRIWTRCRSTSWSALSRGCLGGGRPGTAPHELALGPSASAAPAAGPRLPWRSEATGPEAPLFWFVLSAWTTCLWGFLFFHGQVQNHGQGSPGTPRAAAGRRLSSPASSCTPWHQGTRGPCAVPCGGCPAIGWQMSTRGARVGRCHSVLRAMLRRTSSRVTDVCLWVGFFEAAPWSSCQWVHGARVSPLLPQSLARGGGVQPVGFGHLSGMWLSGHGEREHLFRA